MRKLALFIFPVLGLGLASTATAAAPSKALQTAAQSSFAHLKAQRGSAAFAGDRLAYSSNGKTAQVRIERYGTPMGPIMLHPRPAQWNTVETANFVKASDGKWAKSGRWNTLYYALGAAK